jgi:CIC family chloride channel protein
VDRRVAILCSLCVAVAVVAGFGAQALSALIALLTNVAFFGQFSTAEASPAGHHLGWTVVFVPVVGALVVSVMARYGSKAIRGHGIPEAWSRCSRAKA